MPTMDRIYRLARTWSLNGEENKCIQAVIFGAGSDWVSERASSFFYFLGGAGRLAGWIWNGATSIPNVWRNWQEFMFRRPFLNLRQVIGPNGAAPTATACHRKRTFARRGP